MNQATGELMKNRLGVAWVKLSHPITSPRNARRLVKYRGALFFMWRKLGKGVNKIYIDAGTDS